MKKLLTLLCPLFLLSSTQVLAQTDTAAAADTATAAATDASATQQDAALTSIDKQNKALEKQLEELRAQVKELESNQTAVKNELKISRTKIQQNRSAIKQLDKTKTTAPALDQEGLQPSGISNSFSARANGDPQYLGALRESVSVITSPYLGLRSSYDASDLIVNLPSMNEDLVLLLQRKDMEKQAQAVGLPYGDRPLIMVSGDLLPQFIFGNNYQKSSISQVTLSGAELDIQAISSRWAAGFLALNYDNSTPTATGLNVSSVNNSRVYVSRGFVTVGDLNVFPTYLTAGQMYAPFGIYSNSLVTSPLTQAIGRALIRSAMLGYAQNGVYAEAYAYNGDTYVNSRRNINEGGFNGGYKHSNEDWTYDFGAGYISNMADAQGAQSNSITSSGQFQGFGEASAAERIQHRVPGGDVHTEIRYKNWNFNAEYVGAFEAYSTADMTYNTGGAKPQASHLELDYNRLFLNRPWTFAVAYDHSWEALAYNIAEQSYFGVVSVSIWKDTIESIEFRHDINYPSTASAIGSAANSATAITPLGNSRNTITMQLGFYF